nr:MAG TPA: Repressor protein CI [Caudoviricetes sp.]
MFSRNLKEARERAGLSQREVAGKVFVSPQAVGKWERGEATPSPEAVAKLAELFQVSADELLDVNTKKLGIVADAEDPLESEILKHTAMLSRAEKEMLLAQLRGITAERDGKKKENE